MDFVATLTAFFEANPVIAVAIVFLIALTEALIIIGLFVPSTAVILGAGALVGMGKLALWPVFLAAWIGAVFGDAISYWVGRVYGSSLKALWPLRRYPKLVNQGEAFFEQHGMKSIAIGRFIPAVKAIIPGIAGIMGMDNARFTLINGSSAAVWAAAHLIPGIMIGAGLSFANHISPRLLELLGVVLILIAAAIWITRIFALWLGARLQKGLTRISNRAQKSSSNLLRGFGRAIDPGSAHGPPTLVWGTLLLFAAVALASTIEAMLSSSHGFAMDHALSHMLQSLRTGPGDQLMIAITMLSDAFVLYGVALVLLGILLWRSRFLEAGIVTIAFLATITFVPLAKLLFHRERPGNFGTGPDMFSFPSGHAALATVVLGLLVVVSSRSAGPRLKASLYALLATFVVLTGISRIYLVADWPSDILAGIAFGVALTSIAALALPNESVEDRPSGGAILLPTLICFVCLSATHLYLNFAQTSERYERASRVAMTALQPSAWLENGYLRMPGARSDFQGEPHERFTMQLSASADDTRRRLEADGWKAWIDVALTDQLRYLSVEGSTADLPPLPIQHDGWPATATFSKQVPGHESERFVIRMWRSHNFTLRDTQARKQQQVAENPIYLVAVDRERLARPYRIITIANDVPIGMPTAFELMKPIIEGAEIFERRDYQAPGGSKFPILLVAR
ncbi:MAG: hypothetical protein RLZ98_2058 [Pseudomonadota bacterium]